MDNKEITEIEVIPTNNLASLTAATPEEMISRATAYADVLKKMIVKQKLYTAISGKNHVNIEGWSTLGTLLGVMPFIEWSRKCEGNSETDIAYEARCVLKSMSGQVVGAGEAMASKSEGSPWGKNMFSIRSMAETRATGKAFRLSFAWIMKLAGYEGLPLEEVSVEKPKKLPVETSTVATADSLNSKVDELDDKASPAQIRMMFALCKQVGLTEDVAKDYLHGLGKVEHMSEITKDIASVMIKELQVQAEAYEKPKTLDDKIKGSVFNPDNKPTVQGELTEKDMKEVFNG